MALRPFDFADIDQPHAKLAELPDDEALRERLRARALRGSTPTCAAAILAERGDRSVAALLVGVAAYLDPPDLAGLAALDATDAMCAALTCPWVSAISRTAAATHLRTMTPSATSLAALAAVADSGAREPYVRAAADALADVTVRADKAMRANGERLRNRAMLAKQWTGIRRQELQREFATGELPASLALLSGDPMLLAGLVPPIPDTARPALVPALLANVRAPDDAARTRTFALFHGRWRELAREPLCALARMSALRGRDTAIPSMAVAALARMGAFREVLIAAVSAVPDARNAAFVALEQAGARAFDDVDRDLVSGAIERFEFANETAFAERLKKLAPH